MLKTRFLQLSATLVALVAFLPGCGKEEAKYEPAKASTTSVSLPAVPSVPSKPVKDGDSYTVWGASYSLRNRVHTKEVADTKITVVGYIIKTNLGDAPECAVHPAGKADPEGCRAPIPTFWIADSKDADVKDAMKVMGFASNYAQLYDAIKAFDSPTKKELEPGEAEYSDQVWGVPVPNPLPAVGAKAKVTGTYSVNFTMSSGGAEADPIMGILTYGGIEYLEEAAELSTLPGVKRKPPKKD
jgi:hypothetical protein